MIPPLKESQVEKSEISEKDFSPKNEKTEKNFEKSKIIEEEEKEEEEEKDINDDDSDNDSDQEIQPTVNIKVEQSEVVIENNEDELINLDF